MLCSLFYVMINIMPCMPSIWWEAFGECGPELQRFAIRVLSHTCPTSICKRNWSLFKHMHSKNAIKESKISPFSMFTLLFPFFYLSQMNSKNFWFNAVTIIQLLSWTMLIQHLFGSLNMWSHYSWRTSIGWPRHQQQGGFPTHNLKFIILCFKPWSIIPNSSGNFVFVSKNF